MKRENLKRAEDLCKYLERLEKDLERVEKQTQKKVDIKIKVYEDGYFRDTVINYSDVISTGYIFGQVKSHIYREIEATKKEIEKL